MFRVLPHGAVALFVVAFSFEAGAALTVVSTSPGKNAVGIATSAPVVITFNQALDPTTVLSSAIRVSGKFSGPVTGALALNAAQTTVTFTPSRPYFVAEAVAI